MAGWNHAGKFKEKECRSCGKLFKPNSGAHFYCSKDCGFQASKYSDNTDDQYERISGNWPLYLSRLLYAGGDKRKFLSREVLFDILASQDFKCALSGVPLTCKLQRGTIFWTNASVDRIDAGGPYSKDNIQLVCRGLNSWRSSIPVDDFIWWCRQVVEHSEKRKEE